MSLDAAPKLRAKQSLLFAAMATTGTVPALGATQGTIQCFNLQPMEYTTETVEKESQASFSPIPQATGARSATMSFEIEMAGQGSGLAPVWLPLLQACGTAVSTGVITPVTSPTYTIALAYQEDGRQKILSDAMGEATFMFRRGKPTRIKFDFTGVQQEITDTALVFPTYVTTPKAPQVASAYTFGGTVIRTSQLDFSLGNQIIMREDILGVNTAGNAVGYRAAMIVNRKPTLKLDPEALAVATLNYYGLQISQALSAVGIAVGAASDNTFTFSWPAVQIAETPREGTRTGLIVDEITGLCTGVQDGEWTLTLA